MVGFRETEVEEVNMSCKGVVDIDRCLGALLAMIIPRYRACDYDKVRLPI